MRIPVNMFFKPDHCISKYFNITLEKQILFFSYYVSKQQF
jgi:hypothetical protein